MNLNEIILNVNSIFKNEKIDFKLNKKMFDQVIIESAPRTEIARWNINEFNKANSEVPGGIIERLYDSRTHGVNFNGNNQSHFFISPSSRPLFIPFVNNDIGEKYTMCYPFEMAEKNLNLLLNHIPSGYYNPDRIKYLLHKYSSNNHHILNFSIKMTGNRVMFASKDSVSPEENREFFLENRYAFFETDYFIILKFKKEMKYFLVFIPAPAAIAAGVDFSRIKGKLVGSMSSTPLNLLNNVRKTGGKNILVFGAPGTGKSWWVQEEYENKTESVRVTFHEEYSYQDFIGSLRPSSKDKDIVYKFKPGPLSKILALAFNNPAIEYTLIIEELNRANAASVFGDVFQLLDRDPDGLSEYGIEQEDILQYINNNLNNYSIEEVRIPPNLNLIATMNSADQGVFPLDMAFKRRWQYEYIPISFKAWHSSERFVYAQDSVANVKKEISIKDFIEQLNDYMATDLSLEINEDRLIGPYFLKDYEWETFYEKGNFKKILAYLWDDVARVDREALFKSGYTQFHQLCNDFSSTNQVFTDNLHSNLLSKCIDIHK